MACIDQSSSTELILLIRQERLPNTSPEPQFLIAGFPHRIPYMILESFCWSSLLYSFWAEFCSSFSSGRSIITSSGSSSMISMISSSCRMSEFILVSFQNGVHLRRISNYHPNCCVHLVIPNSLPVLESWSCHK